MSGEELPVSLPRAAFQLRFARCRELGRSDVSLVKPFGLPATVTDKFYRGPSQQPADEALEAAALRRIEHMFALGPREKHPRPITSAHEYGWWGAGPRSPWLQRPLRDSCWLRARVRVLHADAQLRQR